MILYIQVNTYLVMSGWIPSFLPGLRIKSLAQGYKAGLCLFNNFSAALEHFLSTWFEWNSTATKQRIKCLFDESQNSDPSIPSLTLPLSQCAVYNTSFIKSELKKNGFSVHMLDWLKSLKQLFINVSYHKLVACLTLMALFKKQSHQS